jgi:primosomal protein N''
MEEVRRRAKQRKISSKNLRLFKKKGGVYQIVRRKNLEGTNLCQRIYRCDNAIARIEKVLNIVNHTLDFEIKPLGVIKKAVTKNK